MRTVVAVVRGGPSPEYDVSLKTGASVLSALNRERYEPRDIFISRQGEWHLGGVPMSPERALRGADVAFNAVHGHYGEDGTLQRLLDELGVPYTGSGAHASSVAFNKQRTREALGHSPTGEAVAVAGIKIPHGVIVDSDKITDLEATALNLFRSLPQPSVVRPAAAGRGAAHADSYHALRAALESAFMYGDKVLVEEYIPGRAAAVGVIDNFRGQSVYALIPLGRSPMGEASPNAFTHDEKDLLTAAARGVHHALGLGHYSQVRLRHGRRGVYLTGLYTSPHIYEGSTFYSQLAEVGAPLPHFLDHVISLARGKK